MTKQVLGFLSEEVVKIDLDRSDKSGVIGELIDVLVTAGKVDAKNRDALELAILEREKLGSTGIGSGLAIPHVKASALVNDMVGAFGRSVDGVEFGSSDGEPVKLVFLMVSPEGGVQEHLQILRKIATLGRNEHYLRFLREATSAAEVISTLEEMDER